MIDDDLDPDDREEISPSHFPGIDDFYSAHEVVTSADQLEPGMKLVEYCGYEDPRTGGILIEILGKPGAYTGSSKELQGHATILVRRYFSDGFKTDDHLFLQDYGVMPEGKKPYNKNRLVIGWN